MPLAAHVNATGSLIWSIHTHMYVVESMTTRLQDVTSSAITLCGRLLLQHVDYMVLMTCIDACTYVQGPSAQ